MGRSGIVILIAIVLIAVGAYFVLHKKAGTEPAATGDTTAPIVATPAPAEPAPAPASATPEAAPAPTPAP